MRKGGAGCAAPRFSIEKRVYRKDIIRDVIALSTAHCWVVDPSPPSQLPLREDMPCPPPALKLPLEEVRVEPRATSLVLPMDDVVV
jgi:hypothetical protein